MAGISDQVALVQQYADVTVRLRDAATRAVEMAWSGLASWREQDVQVFLDQVLPVVTGSVEAMATMTDAYLSALLADMVGTVALGGQARGGYPRLGVTPEQVYRRPFLTTWTALAKGVPFDRAAQAGRARASSLVATDLQLAKRDASQARLAKEKRVVGYRRVLVGSKSCGLCALAASQRYRKAKLMPVHPGCNCAVAPIVGDQDPGHIIDTHAVRDLDALEAGDVQTLDTLDPLHAAISERFGGWSSGGRTFTHQGRELDYRDLVVEHEHGELGPVLARKGDHFTGPDDI